MPVYAVGITPLLPVHANHSLNDETKQIAFADDLLGAGKLRNLRDWWSQILIQGPRLGYYPNASKTWLVVKQEVVEQAKVIFRDTSINITCEGRKYLGGFIGTNTSRDEYAKDLVSNWNQQLQSLCKVAKSEPQAAFNGFCTGFRHKLTYHMRVLPNLSEHLNTLDAIIDNSFIPAITGGHFCSRSERSLLSLPFNKGGMSIPRMKELAAEQHHDSKVICQQLMENIVKQDRVYHINKSVDLGRKREVVGQKEEKQKQQLLEIRQSMSDDEKRANDIARLKGSSSWLSAAPSIHDDNFSLNKREFNDAVSIRYRWQPKYLPTICECGKSFSVDHALSCMKGGFIHARHDDLRNTFANLLSETCNDVAVEPSMLALNGDELERGNRQDEARLDVAARGFWQRGQRAFFDVRVFHPFARSHVNRDLQAVFVTNEKEKKRAYNQRVIEVEHGSFTPLVFSSLGGCGREAETFLGKLSEKIATKRDIEKGRVLHWLRHKVSLSIMRSAILCLRGSRSVRTIVPSNSENILLTNI